MNFPSLVSLIKSASFSTDKCLEIDGAVTEKCSVISPADFFSAYSEFHDESGQQELLVSAVIPFIQPPLTINLIVNYYYMHKASICQ